MRHLLEQIQICFVPKDGRDRTDSMEHEADSRNSVEETDPIWKRMRRRRRRAESGGVEEEAAAG